MFLGPFITAAQRVRSICVRTSMVVACWAEGLGSRLPVRAFGFNSRWALLLNIWGLGYLADQHQALCESSINFELLRYDSLFIFVRIWGLGLKGLRVRGSEI